MEEEYQFFLHNKTWTLTPLPSDRTPISCCSLLKRKYNPDDTIARFKALLVARGYTRVPGFDYHDTFSPVVCLISLQVLFALAVGFNPEVDHLDIQTIFLHGDLPDELYMSQPQHFVSSKHHSNMYIRHTPPLLLIIALYINDIAILCSTRTSIKTTKVELHLLHTYAFDNVKPIHTPLALKTKYSIYDAPSDSTFEASLSLIIGWSTNRQVPLSCFLSRFHLCFDINYLSYYMYNPSLTHWYSLKECLRYLQHTKFYGIHYTGGAVAWFCEKQTFVALSPAEAEFVAIALITKEGISLQTLLKELLPMRMIPLKIMCDNQSCIHLASNPKHSEKTKHVDRKYHFIRELVEQKKIHLSYVSTHITWTDLLTTSLAADKFILCTKHLGL
ncbi:hypothetical protein KP509_1Z217100 [Ceratopteris richardii]|nr:hypothetical protein KP509_1Z217100 [Ceratopteris richardii]